jgi:hypothetical protein
MSRNIKVIITRQKIITIKFSILRYSSLFLVGDKLLSFICDKKIKKIDIALKNKFRES